MRTVLVSASLAMAGSVLFAQDIQPVAQFVPVQSVLTVQSRQDHDKNVPAMDGADVMAYERNERLKVTDLASLEGKNAGLELFVLIDDASSTAVASQFGDLRRFIESQPETTSVGVGYMHNGTVDIVQSLTKDHARAARRLRIPFSIGGITASPYLSLSDLIKNWPASSARREVIMVTSGVDSLGGYGPMNPYLDAAIEDAQRNEIIVYPIYMPSAGSSGLGLYRLNWAQSYLAELAQQTGGEAYMLGFGAPVAFAPYLDGVNAHLAHQYRVTLLMKPERNARLRAVRFTTEVPNAEIVAAAKVYVPASPKGEPER